MRELLVVFAILALANQVRAFSYYLDFVGGNQYYVDTGYETNWYGAFSECEERNMTLVTLESQKKIEQIKNMFEMYITDEDLAGASLFIGGYKPVEENFQWTTNNVDIVYDDVEADEDMCLYLTGNSIELKAKSCMSLQGFICEGNKYKSTVTKDAYTSESDKHRKSHRRAMAAIARKHQHDLDVLRKSMGAQLEAVTKELELLKKSHEEEVQRLRNACEDKILTHLAKELEMSRIQRYNNLILENKNTETAGKDCIYSRLAELVQVEGPKEDQVKVQRHNMCVPKTLAEH